MFCPEHIPVLLMALQRRNFPMLDFLVSVCNAFVPSEHVNCFLNRCNENKDIRMWLIRNKHIVSSDWNISRLHWEYLLELVDAGVFPYLSDVAFTKTMINQNAMFTLLHRSHIGKTMKPELFAVLSRLTHIGTEDQRQTIIKTLCMFFSLRDLQCLLRFPVMQQVVTFNALRQAQRDFLSRMVANEPSIEYLEWFATWRDAQQQTLTLTDVFAKNNSLMRLATRTNDRQLQDWITKISNAPFPLRFLFDGTKLTI